MAKRLQAVEEKLRKAKNSNAQTIFDMEREAIRKLYIHTPLEGAMPENPEQAIRESERNDNPPPPPEGSTRENTQDNDKKRKYIEYYLKGVQRLGGDNAEN
jgi:hypothetical protein